MPKYRVVPMISGSGILEPPVALCAEGDTGVADSGNRAEGDRWAKGNIFEPVTDQGGQVPALFPSITVG
jgi:hypothetical protein